MDRIELIVQPPHVGQRLDAFLAEHLSQHSRVKLRRAIQAGGVTVDGRRTKAAYRLREGEQIEICLPDLPDEGPQPENIPLDVLYEDDWIVAVNKPPFMVVHPAKGHWSGTLASALAFHFQSLSTAGGPARPGIVHRLDRDTSGVIVVAKTDQAHMALSAQFESRTVEKEYFALVAPPPDRDRDVIRQPIGAHPYQREKMAIRAGHHTSRQAETFYEVLQRFDGFAAVKVIPKTGRTHQIRLHLAHIGCPVVCDRQYGGRSQLSRGDIRRVPDDDHVLLSRHALHARRLKVRHPQTNQLVEFEAKLPTDLADVLAELRAYRT